MERRFVHGLRFKVAIGVALPVFVALNALSLLQYSRERQIQLDRLEDEAVLLGEVIRGSLRHGMLLTDDEMLSQTIRDIGMQQSVLRLAIVNASGEVRLSDPPEDFEPKPTFSSPGCVECHRPSGMLDRHSLVISLPGQSPMLRSSILIPNEPECAACHDPALHHLGVLIADFSLSDLERKAVADLKANLALSALATVLLTLGAYALIHRVVVRRVERFQLPLRAFSTGDFSARVPVRESEADELARLASAVNGMAESLGKQAELERQAHEARTQAILEERQRLARELHDGVAQVIGYVSTKALAARLLLRRGENAEAAEQLRQLETAAQGVFGDLRQAILDLKTSLHGEHGLASALEEYTTRFGAQYDIPVELHVDDGIACPPLSAESEVQVLRIVQEALTNVRKHSGATRAWVRLELDSGESARITVADNGQGFDPDAPGRDHRPRFGLPIMRERAEAVGGTFTLESAPGGGTRIVVDLPVRAKEEHANGSADSGRR